MSDVDLFGVEQRTKRSISSHETTASSTDEWLTPPSVIAALGAFDLDPCSPGDRRPWDTAAKHYSLEDDGLRKPWEGRVWLNPPYSSAAQWMARLAEHNQGTALIFARTETRMWFDHIWPRASGLLFLKGRLRFCYVTGKEAGAAGAPSVLVAYGARDAEVLSSIPIPGHYVSLSRRVA
jgi:phage N-6-adenine-methyltransferase